MLPWVALMGVAASDWTLHYERSGFLETGRHAEAVDYCRRLDAASDMAKCITFGTSPEGRDMVALVVSADKRFAAKDLRSSKKPLVLLNNGIHSGEIEGKDADLMLAREMLITGKERALLDKVNLMIVPIFSVDAHERFGAYNRINQNGPKEMGWRVTSRNLNLNRDWVKADAVEMRAMLALIRDYDPSFLFDNHTTDGGDWQYVVTADVPTAPDVHPAVREFSKKLLSEVMPQVESDGFLNAPYFGLNDARDPGKGITVDAYSPRYSHTYVAALDRPSMLVETHVLKPYKQRVDATYSINKRTIEFIGNNAAELMQALSQADTAATSLREGMRVVLQSKLSGERRPFTFRGYAYTPVQSGIAGAEVSAWDRSKPVSIESWIRDQFEPSLTVTAPAAYAIPPQWTDVVTLLDLHGIHYSRLAQATEQEFRGVRLGGVRFPSAPFEGRFSPSYEAQPLLDKRVLIAGTVVVPVAQVRGKLAMHLFEPEADDSLLKWGFFNAIFERKEYFEDYAMEPEAARMLERDPKLKAEFDERLKDPAFAKNPRARLQFFYERSEWEDEVLNRYPVVMLTSSQLAKLKLR